jgi:hypothetical protein
VAGTAQPKPNVRKILYVISSTKKPPTNRWEHRYLGEERFPETLSGLEIEHFLKMTGRTLNPVELIPPQILDHLGRQVDCVAPRIGSIQAFYRRRHRTLCEHHATALRLERCALPQYLPRRLEARGSLLFGYQLRNKHFRAPNAQQVIDRFPYVPGQPPTYPLIVQNYYLCIRRHEQQTPASMSNRTKRSSG